jgi:hypothetical protein
MLCVPGAEERVVAATKSGPKQAGLAYGLDALAPLTVLPAFVALTDQHLRPCELAAAPMVRCAALR